MSPSFVGGVISYLEQNPKFFENDREFADYIDFLLTSDLVAAKRRGSPVAGLFAVEAEENNLSRLELLEMLESMEKEELAEGRSPVRPDPQTDRLVAIPTLGPDGLFSGDWNQSVDNIGKIVASIGETDPLLARFAVLRLFGELRLAEISERLSLSLGEVRRDWERLKEVINVNCKRASPIVVLPIESNLLKALRRDPKLLKSLDWRTFEIVLSSILERLGFEIELQRGTKDGGIDIFALKCDPALGAHRYLIQAKRWSHRVGIEPVRELLFLQSHHRASKACLATTATFSRGAWRLAEEYRWQLELRDLHGLQDWLGMALGEG